MHGFSLLLNEEMLQEAIDAIRQRRTPGQDLRLELCVHLAQDGVSMIVTCMHSQIIEIEAAQDAPPLDADEIIGLAEELVRGEQAPSSAPASTALIINADDPRIHLSDDGTGWGEL